MFPGLKKLEKELNFTDNGSLAYGIIKNTLVAFCDGNNEKLLYLSFAEKLSEEDKEKILSWEKKGYATKIDFPEEDLFNAIFHFREIFAPFKIEKIKEIIMDITDYFYEKYPEAVLKCCGKDCESDTDIKIYNLGSSIVLLCPSCANKIQKSMDEAYEDFNNEPNNYLSGTIGALLCAIPGVIVTFIFFLLERLTALSGAVYYLLAMKGYKWLKGKFNKVGVLIVGIISLLYTAAGTFVSYIACIIYKLYKKPDMKGVPIGNTISYVLEIAKRADVKKEILQNIYLSLFLCGICIVLYIVEGFKQTKKITLKK